MDLRSLPVLNACLNGLSAVFLLSGYYFIRTRQKERHRACMLVALGCSVLFLVSYVTYHWSVGSVRFSYPGWPRTVYLVILFTHTVLAVSLVPLVIITLNRALRERFDKHRRIARWTFPIWLYVSVTGVIIYLMLYQIWPNVATQTL